MKKLLILFTFFLLNLTVYCQNIKVTYFTKDTSGYVKFVEINNKSKFLELFKDTGDITFNHVRIIYNGNLIYKNCVLSSKTRIEKKTDNLFSLYESYVLLMDGKFSHEQDEIMTDENIIDKEIIKYDMEFTDNSVSVKLDTQFYKNSISINFDTTELFKNYERYKENYTNLKGPELMQLLTRLTISAIQGCNECVDLVENFDKSFVLFGAYTEFLTYSKTILNKTIKRKIE